MTIEKKFNCPARINFVECYISGRKCEFSKKENCMDYQEIVKPRGEELYRAVIQVIEKR